MCLCVQPWTGIFNTNNYVKYQRAGVGGVNRSNSTYPDSCLVVAKGTTYPELTIGLGSIHPNCRVSHYGFTNNNATKGWSDTAWLGYSESSPRNADEGINLNFLFDVVESGGSVTFSWVYILRTSDLVTAMGDLGTVSIVQPSTTVSGSEVTFSAMVGGNGNPVVFTVKEPWTGVSRVVGTLRQPSVGDGKGGGLYKILVNMSSYATGDGYEFGVAATVNGRVVTTSRLIRVDNMGPQIRMSISPVLSDPYVMDNVNPSVVTVSHVGGPAVSYVTFYKEMESWTSLIGTVSAPPFSVEVMADDVRTGGLLTIKAVAYSAVGDLSVQTKISGIVKDESSTSATATISLTPSVSPTVSFSKSAGFTESSSTSATPSSSGTDSPSDSSSESLTASESVSGSVTASVSATASVTPTLSESSSRSPSRGAPLSVTPTISTTGSASVTMSASVTRSSSLSGSVSSSGSRSGTKTPTVSKSFTSSRSASSSIIPLTYPM